MPKCIDCISWNNCFNRKPWDAEVAEVCKNYNPIEKENCHCQFLQTPYRNTYSIEIDSQRAELSVWDGDACLRVFHINYCPICGAKMEVGK